MKSGSDSHYDFVIIGSGFSGISIARALNDLGETSICIISLEPLAGGLWLNQGASSRLHHPSNIYLVPGVPPATHYHKNDNLYCATAAEVQAYAEQCSNSLSASHVQGCVSDVSRNVDGQLVIKLSKATDSPCALQTIHCKYAIQATGHGHWAGEPRLLNLPLETHSANLGKMNAKKCCLVVGSGRSAADTVKYLVQKGCRVHVLYRSPTVYWRKIDTTLWNRLFERLLAVAQSLAVHLSSTQAAEKEWDRELIPRYTDKVAKTLLHWWSGTHWCLGAHDGNIDPRALCRGAGLSRFEYVVLNMFYHAYGMQGDASKTNFLETISSVGERVVHCELFPGVEFDQIVTATGYKGSTRRFELCMDATTMIAEPAPYNAYLVGRMLHAIKDDVELLEQWSSFLDVKPEFPYLDANLQAMRWAQQHVKPTLVQASIFFKDFMRINNTFPASWIGAHAPAGKIVFLDSSPAW
eukprot:CAMPEP_0181371044 /NCGR_PEP_ID=MMETSP1106-20121128/13811_1 /TAXON_ID=81844 /ORGANISM="Mantoniella antarctica, Strain SL-175" /LENGTH=466 /DNA_ID=CAMNT_0023488001 /DNA_START=111 /DNA_END=1508 /DNA_ORIENTATION=-